LNARFVDANVFLRYLTNDDPAKAASVERLLDQAANGDIRLVTTEMVLAEIVWVLESYYGRTREQIATLVKGVLATPELTVLNGHLIGETVELYENGRLDFIDAYLLARMAEQGIDEIYSYDKKHLSKIPGVTRLEP